jgi:hypothetical protein
MTSSVKSFVFLCCFAVLQSCGGGGGGTTSTYTVGGTVSGLTGSGLVLQNNTGDDLSISESGAFTFATALADGAAYAVTVKTQPSNPTQSCSVSNGTGTISAANVTDVAVTCAEPPIIYDIGITLSPYDPATHFAGDVDFRSDVADDYGDRLFIEFGGLLEGIPNVHPTFIVPLGTEIHAVSQGTVYQISALGENDYDVCVHRNAGDEWCVSYEHVRNLHVAEGDAMEVGDVVGEAGVINEFTTSGKFDLKIWKGGGTILDYCPYALFDSSVEPEMQTKITRFVSDWESYIGKSVYNEDEWVSVGCVYETLNE